MYLQRDIITASLVVGPNLTSLLYTKYVQMETYTTMVIINLVPKCQGLFVKIYNAESYRNYVQTKAGERKTSGMNFKLALFISWTDIGTSKTHNIVEIACVN